MECRGDAGVCPSSSLCLCLSSQIPSPLPITSSNQVQYHLPTANHQQFLKCQVTSQSRMGHYDFRTLVWSGLVVLVLLCADGGRRGRRGGWRGEGWRCRKEIKNEEWPKRAK
jgi:hypothetical protein